MKWFVGSSAVVQPSQKLRGKSRDGFFRNFCSSSKLLDVCCLRNLFRQLGMGSGLIGISFWKWMQWIHPCTQRWFRRQIDGRSTWHCLVVHLLLFHCSLIHLICVAQNRYVDWNRLPKYHGRPCVPVYNLDATSDDTYLNASIHEAQKKRPNENLFSELIPIQQLLHCSFHNALTNTVVPDMFTTSESRRFHLSPKHSNVFSFKEIFHFDAGRLNYLYHPYIRPNLAFKTYHGNYKRYYLEANQHDLEEVLEIWKKIGHMIHARACLYRYSKIRTCNITGWLVCRMPHLQLVLVSILFDQLDERLQFGSGWLVCQLSYSKLDWHQNTSLPAWGGVLQKILTSLSTKPILKKL